MASNPVRMLGRVRKLESLAFQLVGVETLTE